MPRCPSVVQRVLRAEVTRAGFALVDLPRVFDEHLAGRIPGREHFIDYCHHSIEGLRVAVTAIAGALLPLLGALEAEPPRPGEVAWEIAPQTVGQAHLWAAVQAAHWGQTRERVAYQSARAIEVWPEIVPVMSELVELSAVATSTPAWVTVAAERLARRGTPAFTKSLLARLGAEERRLFDRVLVEELVRYTGPEIGRRMEARRNSELGGRKARSLEGIFFAPSLGHREGRRLGPVNGIDLADCYRAYSDESLFSLVLDEPRVLRCRLTVRLSTLASAKLASPTAKQSFEVRVNGASVFTSVLEGRWRTHAFWLPRELLRAGINDVALRWPEPPLELDAAERIASALEASSIPEYYSLFGEIHAFAVAI